MVITDEMKLIIIAEVDKAIDGMKDWEDSVDSAGREIEETTKAMEKDFKNLEFAANKVANGMLVWTGVVAAAGGAGLKFAGSIESQKVAFEVLTGSAETAAELYENLQDLSIKTPLEPEEVNASAEALLTFQFSVSEVDDQLVRLGNLAKGKPELLDRITIAYGRMHLKGKASMEEINMLTEAGVPILSELTDQYGVTTEELFKMVSAGKVGFGDVEQAVVSLTSEGGQFEGMMERMSQTMEGKWSTAVGSLKIALADAMESFVPVAKEVLDTVADLATRFTELDDSTKKTILTLIGISAAVGPALKLALAINKNKTALRSIFTLAKNGGPALAGPWGVAALAIGAATLAIISYQNKHREAMEEMAGGLDSVDTGKEVRRLNSEILGAFDVIKKARDAAANYGYEYLGKDEAEAVKEIAKEYGVAAGDVAKLAIELGKGNDALEEMVRRGEENKENQAAMLEYTQAFARAQKELIEKLKEEEALKASIKTWEEWFDTITGFDPKDYGDSGTLAAQAYLDALSAELQNAESFSKAIGQKLDPAPYLKEQAKAIEGVLKDLYNIDPGTLEGASFFAKGEDKTVQTLILRLKEINEELNKLGDTAEEKEESVQSLFSSLYQGEIDAIAERKEAMEAYYTAQKAWAEAAISGRDEEAAIYANIIDSLEEMYGLNNKNLTTSDLELTNIQAIAKQLDISEEKAAGVLEVMDKIPGLTAEGADALVDFNQGLENIFSQAAAADFMADSFSAIGTAMAEGTSVTDALGDSFNSFMSGILSQIGSLAIGAGLRIIMEGGLAGLGMGIALIGLGGVSLIASSFMMGSADKPRQNYDSMIMDVVDEEKILHEERMANLADELAEAKKARSEGLKDLEKSISLEFSVLKDQWDRNLITTDQFKSGMEALTTQYSTTAAALEAPVTQVEEEKAAEEAAAKALKDARAKKVSDLAIEASAVQKKLEGMSGWDKFWTQKDEQYEGQLNVIDRRIAAAKAAGSIAEVNAAALGADFVTSGPQMLLVGENPGGRERVQVTPLSSPNINGPRENSGSTVVIQGDVYGIEDLYGKLQSAGFKLQATGRA